MGRPGPEDTLRSAAHELHGSSVRQYVKRLRRAFAMKGIRIKAGASLSPCEAFGAQQPATFRLALVRQDVGAEHPRPSLAAAVEAAVPGVRVLGGRGTVDRPWTGPPSPLHLAVRQFQEHVGVAGQ